MVKLQNVGLGILIVAGSFMALIYGIVSDSTPTMVVSSYSLVISTLIMVISMGTPLLRLPVQVISFGAHRLGIFRKLPGGWHAEIPRTAGVTCTLNCQACELAWVGCP
ncbi:MAG: hypothetical protein JSW25_03110, partial [Thermoplasmata archaeon]